MDIRSLSNDALKEIIHQLLEPGDARAIINKHPLLAANIPLLEAARGAFAKLKAARASDEKESARLAEQLEDIEQQIEAEDSTFDNAARAAHALLSCAEDVLDDAALSERVAAVRDKLFPRKLTVVNLSAAEESGTARTLEESIDRDDEALLAKIKLDVRGKKFTALSLVQLHVAAGRKLGKLAAKREALLAKKSVADAPAESERSPALARYSAARNAIVSAVINFRNDVTRTPGLTAAERGSLLGTIERLAANKRSATKPAPDSAPST
jgi:hypothetical protein